MIKILLQIIAVLVGAIALLKTIYDFKKKRDGILFSLLWCIVWTIIIIVSIFPQLFYDLVTNLAKDKIGFGTFAGIGFVFLTFLIYRLYAKYAILESKIKAIVTEAALKKIKK